MLQMLSKKMARGIIIGSVHSIPSRIPPIAQIGKKPNLIRALNGSGG
jgi:hypothetical protein